jgi:ATP-dependent DNA ligase
MSQQIEISVGSKQMQYTLENGQYSLPRLCSKNKNGADTFWEIYVVNDCIFRKSYIKSGKVREFPEIKATPKNVGKKNETTSKEQALFEAHSLWSKKQDQGYMAENSVEGSGGNSGNTSKKSKTKSDKEVSHILPMLANKFHERKKHLKLPFGISRKLDGIRVVATFEDNKVKLSSRLGKEFSNLEGIRDSLSRIFSKNSSLIIDGELYSHDLPFNTISGAVRSKKKSAVDEQLELWIFDVLSKDDLNMPYESRMELLKSIEKGTKSSNLKFVYYDVCERLEDVEKFHDKYVSEGFEGAMCRNLDGKYLFKNRSNDLLKFKSFEDAEFEIVGAKAGVGTEEGAIVFECTSEFGNFDVRPRGSIQRRREMYENRGEYIHKKLTVRYQPETNEADRQNSTGIPRFPVGIDVRDYE